MFGEDRCVMMPENLPHDGLHINLYDSNLQFVFLLKKRSFAGVYNMELRRWKRGNVRSMTSDFFFFARNFTEDQVNYDVFPLILRSGVFFFIRAEKGI